MRRVLTVLLAAIVCVGCASRPRPVHVWLDRGEYPQPVILPPGTIFETPDGERYELRSQGAVLDYAVLTVIVTQCAEILQGQKQGSRAPWLGREM